jgi:hypothetical protein
LEHFGPDKRKWLGLSCYCRKCQCKVRDVSVRKRLARDPEYKERVRLWKTNYYREQRKDPEKRERANASQRRWKERNPHADRNRQKSPAKVRFYASKRRAALLMATPRWANMELIKQVYEEADKLTRCTGAPHHVDHIVPLMGKTVCGLHVHYNLRVITATENIRKKNKLLPDLLSDLHQ